MENIICIKSVKTKKGFQFNKGNSYDFAIHNDGIVVYFSKFEFVKIKSENTFNKYFK
jgi:hypothetical protein